MQSWKASAELRAVADDSNGAAWLSIASFASSDQTISITCLAEHGGQRARSISLRANTTVVTQACVNHQSDERDLETLEAAFADENSGGAKAVSLASDGPPGAFAAFGLAPHTHDDDRYFSTLTFADPMMIHSSTPIYAGLAVGLPRLFP